ncbi:MAG: UTP--glucose-1-phosphate uridylyltransferase GalU [Paraclostridium dentum]|uniref:UTP--glucose-1-phosphate uridylyltransferase n=1 Tax=Paraclostridium bifermentans TaxID=1490 RepID=A0A5P3XD22_PARBF|nr:UTP--glucose-1-phosphate uridylyltransferase GalU [Paraclostridium bifermentans]MCU9809834.1 UTP--glucose-1-phosphate uridylyltransferase GalU [Paraclostridium sp. AKS46]QEZ67483.1 UTP--glucose-1-phosphate uridylyltransferase [Paraclostridium bifermentans]
MQIKKAIIPAAGLGTRFLPATKSQPKEMLPIIDKPTIHYIVEEAVASGIEEILIVTSRTKKAIEDYFDKSIELEMELENKEKQELLNTVQQISDIANIYYIRQKEPKGLGHAILTTKSFVGNEPFAVLLGDDVITSETPVLKQMIEVYEKYQSSIIGVQSVNWEDVHKYGIISGKFIEDRISKIEDMVEKPLNSNAPSNLAVLGRYIITPDIFPILENQEAGSGGEIQLTDALCKLAKTKSIYSYDFIGKRYDIGNKIGFLQANIEFALSRNDLKDEFISYLRKLNL